MNDSARKGLELLGERGEGRGADAVLSGARAAVRRRRDRGRLALALGVLLVVGVAAAIVAARDSGGDDREIVTQPDDVDGAPSGPAGSLRIFLSDTVLPTSGGEVLTIVRNDGAEDWTGGYGVTIDRWDGTDWRSIGQYPEPQVGGQTDVGMRAPAGGEAQPERIQVPPLEPGWYRLRKGAPSREEKPTGVFEVRAGDVHMIDLPMGQHGLSIEPTLLEHTDAGLLSGHLALTFGWYHPSPPGYGEEVMARLSPGATLDRWDGTAWVPVSTLGLLLDETQLGRATTELPSDLTPGAYRITRTAEPGPDANGYFFVTEDVGTSAPTAMAAPPPDEGPVTLFLSERVLPATGADVVIVLRNVGDANATFGVPTYLDLWDGAAWQEQMLFTTCSMTAGCTGHLQPADFWQDIGISAPPHGYSTGERVRVEGLAAGWYRFRKVANDGTVATGSFEVIDRAVPTVVVGDERAARLGIQPLVVSGPCPPDGCGVRIDPVVFDTGDYDLDSVEAALMPGARIERWVDGAWQAAGQADFSLETRVNWPRGPGQRMAALPPDLAPGAYRLVRTRPDGAELAGNFWVAP